MKKSMFGVMLYLLLIATCFVSSCTKGTQYGSATPSYSNESVEVVVTAPTDYQYPLSGNVTVTVSGVDTNISYELDQMLPQSPEGETTEYVGTIITTTSTSFITVRYHSSNYDIKKTIGNRAQLTRKIEL